jgi:Putative adhesin
MVTWTCRALAALACAFAASSLLAAERIYDKRLEAPAGGRLTLRTDVGSVAIVGSDTHEVVVHAEMNGSDDFLARFAVSAAPDAAGVTVTGRLDRRNWLSWFGWHDLFQGKVRFTIDVPRDYAVDMRTAGGSVDVRQLNASLRGSTSGGSITIRDVLGAIDTRTSGGSIDAARLRGPTQLRTSGGSIRVTDSTGDLDVHASGGSIRLEAIDGQVGAVTSGGSVHAAVSANRGVSLRTSGGSITLLLPASVRASIDAHTSGGRAESTLPLSEVEIAVRNHLRGAINGGGNSILLRTSGGSIHIAPLN